MEKEKISKLNTSELLNKLDIELRKKEPDEILTEKIETEINSRDPFKYIESRIEGNEDTNGLAQDVKMLVGQMEELQKKLKNHDHKDGKVVVKL